MDSLIGLEMRQVVGMKINFGMVRSKFFPEIATRSPPTVDFVFKTAVKNKLRC